MSRNRFRAAAVLAAALILCLAPAVARAEGNSSSMGMMMTVVPDGASDASRNPALLGFQKKDRSLVAALRAAPYTTQSIDIQQNIGFKYEMDSDYSGGLVLAYSKRSDSAVYAISLSSVPDEDQLALKESTRRSKGNQYFDFGGTPASGDYYFESNAKEKVLGFNPALVLALAFPLSGGGFLGMQLITGFSYISSKETSEFTIFTGPPDVHGSTEFTSTSTGFSFEAGFGYTQRLDNGHTGITVRTGRLSFDRETGHSSNTYDPGDSGSTGNGFRYSTGIMILAGVYQRPLPFLGYALEAGYRFPVTYKYRELELQESLVEEKATQVQKKDRFEFKAGLEYVALSSLTFSGGIAFSFDGKDVTNLERNEDDGQSTESQDITFMALTLGAAYRMNENTLFTAMLGFVRAHFEIENLIESDYTRVELMLGAVYNY